MKTTFLSALLLIFCTTFTSCSKSKDDDSNKSEYQGNWTGTYSGDDNGTWDVNINASRQIDGTAQSNAFPNSSFSLSGNVSKNGEFTADVNTTFGTLKFEGQLENDSASGSWENRTDSISGTWQGTRS